MRHDQPKMAKRDIVADIDEWIQGATGDNTDGLRDAGRISLRDLEAIARAIDYSRGRKWTDICHRCGQPILEGQSRYTLGEFKDPPEFCHYDCKQRDDDKLSADLKNFKADCDKALALVELLRRNR